MADAVRAGSAVRPPAMRGYPYVWLAAFLGLLVLLRFVPSWTTREALLYNQWLYYTILVVGFYFVFGVSGQFAFSQAAFAMVGGYTSAWATREGADFLVALAFGVLVACVLAFAFAWIARKANLFFLAIATLALSEIILEVVKQWEEFTGLIGGEISNVKPITLFGWEATNLEMPAAMRERNLFWVFLGALGLAMLVGTWMARSPSKREAIAMRDQPVVASTLGIPTTRVRITMFVLGSAIGAFAGSLWVHGRTFAQPEMFGIELALGVFVMLIVGGIDSLWGPVLGAAFYVWSVHFLTKFDIEIFGHAVREYNQILYGLALLLMMVFVPEGLVGVFRRAKEAVRHATAARARGTWLSDLLGLTKPPLAAEPVVDTAEPLPTPSAEARARAAVNGATIEGPAILSAHDIAVSFGGVHAVDGVSLDLRHEEILGLVGPNGSGKTTFVNALTGIVTATGTLAVDGRRLRLGAPGRSRKAGGVRTYQTPQSYDHLSLVEDVLVSTADRRLTGIAASWFARPWMLRRDRQRWVRATEALTRVGLGGLAEEPVARLTYGQRRLLELARAIAAEPRVLMLDEPSAGLDAAETEQLVAHLRRLRDEGISLLVIDHKLDFITQLCDRVAVLELGHLVAVGPAGTVFEDQRVVDAYLGVDEGAEAP